MPATTWEVTPRRPETKDGASEVKKPNTANPTKAIMAAAAYCPRAAGGTTETITCGAAKPAAPGLDRPVRDPSDGQDRRRLSHPVDTSEAPEGAAATPGTSPRHMGNVEVFYHRFGYSAGLARIDEVPG